MINESFMLEVFHELDEKNLKKLVKIIDDGGVISFPTETVYALAADAANEEAIDKIYKIKRRFSEKSLPILIGDIAQARRIADFDERADKLALHFFPGPLTLILRLKKHYSIAKNVNQSQDTIGIRMPSNVAALKILKAVGRPLVGTSANISNQSSAVSAQEVLKNLGNNIDLLVDKGDAKFGVSSTIIDLTQEKIKILREGALPKKNIEDILNETII